MRNYDWPNEFYKLYHQATELYHKGKRQPRELLTPEAAKSLASIGCTPQELFDFVEDECTDGEPTYGTVLLITAVRRDYFLTVQQGQSSGDLISMQSLPANSPACAGCPVSSPKPKPSSAGRCRRSSCTVAAAIAPSWRVSMFIQPTSCAWSG